MAMVHVNPGDWVHLSGEGKRNGGTLSRIVDAGMHCHRLTMADGTDEDCEVRHVFHNYGSERPAWHPPHEAVAGDWVTIYDGSIGQVVKSVADGLTVLHDDIGAEMDFSHCLIAVAHGASRPVTKGL